MSKPRTVILNLTKDLELEVLADYTHDNDVSDCEITVKRIKHKGADITGLISHLDENTGNAWEYVENKAKEELHREEIENRNEIFKP